MREGLRERRRECVGCTNRKRVGGVEGREWDGMKGERVGGTEGGSNGESGVDGGRDGEGEGWSERRRE